jgi:hypothetical protein
MKPYNIIEDLKAAVIIILKKNGTQKGKTYYTYL